MGDLLKDGTQVCRKFNAGECSEPCPRGYKRVCSVVLNKTGRLCGMANHCALKVHQELGGRGVGANVIPPLKFSLDNGLGTPGFVIAAPGTREVARPTAASAGARAIETHPLPRRPPRQKG